MVVLISGGTSGIGAAIAKQLQKEGHRVFAAGRRVENNWESNEISTLKMDVTSKKSVDQAIDLLYRETGQIDAIIQCAGQGAIGPLEEFSIEDITSVFNLNLLGILRVNQAVLPLMRKQKQGKIILISSLAAESGLPYQSVYCASKAALDVMTEALRMEIHAFGIQACVLQPGDFKTEVSQHRKLPQLDEQSPYKRAFDHIHSDVTKKVDQAADPIQVAKKIGRLLKKKKLRPKYRVAGPIELAMPFVKAILPASWFEKMLMKYYGL